MYYSIIKKITIQNQLMLLTVLFMWSILLSKFQFIYFSKTKCQKNLRGLILGLMSRLSCKFQAHSKPSKQKSHQNPRVLVLLLCYGGTGGELEQFSWSEPWSSFTPSSVLLLFFFHFYTAAVNGRRSSVTHSGFDDMLIWIRFSCWSCFSGQQRSLVRVVGRRYFAASTEEYAKRNYANNVSEYNTVVGSLTAQRRSSVFLFKSFSLIKGFHFSNFYFVVQCVFNYFIGISCWGMCTMIWCLMECSQHEILSIRSLLEPWEALVCKTLSSSGTKWKSWVCFLMYVTEIYLSRYLSSWICWCTYNVPAF